MPPSAVLVQRRGQTPVLGLQVLALELAALTDEKPRSSGQAGNSHKG